MQPVHVTLREVIRILCLRLDATPTKLLFKEQKHDHLKHSTVISAEAVFQDLTKSTVTQAMKGLPLKDVKHGDKTSPWKAQIRWQYEGTKIKFLVTLRVYRDGTYTFFFSTVW